MKRLALLFLFLGVCFGQQPGGSTLPATASRISRGTGAPAVGRCTALADVGKVYFRLDTQAPRSSLYTCSQVGVTTYAWEFPDTSSTAGAPGGIASIVAASGAIVNAEAQVVGFSLPANFMRVGTTFHIHAGGNITTSTTPGNDTFRIRIGTTTLTGNIPVTAVATATASITTQPFTLDAWVTVRTAGAGGTAIGDMIVYNGGSLTTGAFTLATNIGVSTGTVVVDTTAVKIIELTLITGAASSSATFQTATIEVVQL